MGGERGGGRVGGGGLWGRISLPMTLSPPRLEVLNA